MDPDPAIFVIDLQDGHKKFVLKSFSAYFLPVLFEGTFTSLLKDKSQNEVTKK
jgi:hypothetical protein